MRNKTADELMKLANDTSIEATLLTRKLTRKLYKELGEPTRDDFPDAFKHAGSFERMRGYTCHISTLTPEYMRSYNSMPPVWQISHPSDTKLRIVDEYTRDGWSVTVQAYNVMCSMYIRHPRYTNVAVKFYVSRDCAKYEYVLVRE